MHVLSFHEGLSWWPVSAGQSMSDTPNSGTKTTLCSRTYSGRPLPNRGLLCHAQTGVETIKATRAPSNAPWWPKSGPHAPKPRPAAMHLREGLFRVVTYCAVYTFGLGRPRHHRHRRTLQGMTTTSRFSRLPSTVEDLCALYPWPCR